MTSEYNFSLICVFTSLSFILLFNAGGAEAKGKLVLSISPSNPKAEQLVTLTCRIATAAVNNFLYMDMKYGKTRVLMFKKALSRIELRGTWKGRHMDKMDYRDQTLTLKMAAERRDNGLLTCSVVISSYPSIEDDLEANLMIHIQQAPRILSWDLKSKGRYGSDYYFPENSKVHAQCVVDLGWPEAETILDVKGINFLEQQRNQNKQLHDYNYNKSTHNAFVTLSDQENGAKFTCIARNVNGQASESRIVHVWYSVRDLHFPYFPSRSYEAGHVFECSARGNPTPLLNITITPLVNDTRPEDFPAWVRNSTLSYGKARKQVPKDAKPGLYRILCVGTNTVLSTKHRITSRETRVNITAIRTANMALIVGLSVPAGLIFLLIVFCCCKKRKKKAKRKKDERGLDYRLKPRPRNGASGGKEAQSGRAAKDSLVLGSSARPETVWSEESAFSLEPKWPLRGTSSSGLGSSAMGSSYQREEDLDCPLSAQASLATLNVSPRKPARGLNHHHSLDIDASPPATSVSAPPYPEDVAATIHDPQGKGFEAEEEFV